jgi:hypothetical protein
MKIAHALFISLFLIGCSSKSYLEGDVRETYDPVLINGAQKETAALIKTSAGISIWKIDGKREVSAFNVLLSGGYDSILLNEGYHTISCTRGGDINIGKTYYKSGHEYLIDYMEEKDGNRRRVYYWVTDLTDNKVVYGEEKKLSDFAED